MEFKIKKYTLYLSAKCVPSHKLMSSCHCTRMYTVLAHSNSIYWSVSERQHIACLLGQMVCFEEQCFGVKSFSEGKIGKNKREASLRPAEWLDASFVSLDSG